MKFKTKLLDLFNFINWIIQSIEEINHIIINLKILNKIIFMIHKIKF
jgi:hypothetical protein